MRVPPANTVQPESRARYTVITNQEVRREHRITRMHSGFFGGVHKSCNFEAPHQISIPFLNTLPAHLKESRCGKIRRSLSRVLNKKTIINEVVITEVIVRLRLLVEAEVTKHKLHVEGLNRPETKWLSMSAEANRLSTGEHLLKQTSKSRLPSTAPTKIQGFNLQQEVLDLRTTLRANIIAFSDITTLLECVQSTSVQVDLYDRYP